MRSRKRSHHGWKGSCKALRGSKLSFHTLHRHSTAVSLETDETELFNLVETESMGDLSCLWKSHRESPASIVSCSLWDLRTPPYPPNKGLDLNKGRSCTCVWTLLFLVSSLFSSKFRGKGAGERRIQGLICIIFHGYLWISWDYFQKYNAGGGGWVDYGVAVSQKGRSNGFPLWSRGVLILRAGHLWVTRASCEEQSDPAVRSLVKRRHFPISRFPAQFALAATPRAFVSQ